MSDSDSESSDWDSDPEEELAGKYGGEFKTTARKLEFTGESSEMQRLNELLSRLSEDTAMYKKVKDQQRRLVRQINNIKKREKLDQENFERRRKQMWWYQVWERSNETRNSFRRELAELKAKKERGESLDSYENDRLQSLDKLIKYLDKEGDKEEMKEAWLNLGQRKMKTRASQRKKRYQERTKLGGRGGKRLVDLRF